MNSPIRIPLLCALVLFCSPVIFGQKFCKPLPPSPYKHSATILSQFDKKAGKFKTVMEYPPLALGQGARTIAAAFFHHDMRLGFTPNVNLTFAFVVDQSESRHARDMSILVNGSPWIPSEPVGYNSRKLEKGLVLETATIVLSYENLQQMIRARSVQARLGGMDYQLTFDNLEALREVASQIEPYASWNKWKTVGAKRP